MTCATTEGSSTERCLRRSFPYNVFEFALNEGFYIIEQSGYNANVGENPPVRPQSLHCALPPPDHADMGGIPLAS
ncbi:MAG: hypothetical protein LBK73_09860 [Treponema sp.]|nr:hypothetical protein [Treponema sp.]